MPYTPWEHFFKQWDFLGLRKSGAYTENSRNVTSIYYISNEMEFRKFIVNNFAGSILSSEDHLKMKLINIYLEEGDIAYRRAREMEEMIQGVQNNRFNIVKNLLSEIAKDIPLENISNHLEDLQAELEGEKEFEDLAKYFITRFDGLGAQEIGFESDSERLNAIKQFIIKRATAELQRERRGEQLPIPIYIDTETKYYNYRNNQDPSEPVFPPPITADIVRMRWMNPLYLINATFEGSARLTNGLGNYCFNGIGAIGDGMKQLTNYFSDSRPAIKYFLAPVFVGIPVGIAAGASTLALGLVGACSKLAAYTLSAVNVVTSAVAKIFSVSGVVEAYNRIKYGHSRISSTKYTVEHKKSLQGRKSTKDLLRVTSKHEIELAPIKVNTPARNDVPQVAAPISQPNQPPTDDASHQVTKPSTRRSSR